MTFRLTTAILAGLVLAAPAAAQDYGDLVISEISIAPSMSAQEWFEVYNASGASLDLQDCVLYEGHGTGGSPYDWVEHTHTVSESVAVAAGDYAVLLKGDTGECISYDDASATTCIVAADYGYTSVGFNNSDEEHVAVECGGVLLDEITFDWGVFSGDCTTPDGKNCSINLRDELLDADANDDWSSATWCVPLEAATTWDLDGNPKLDTAGEANLCPAILDACGAGDAVITELMAAPADGYKEWIELYGATAAECNLSGCELKQGLSSDPFDGAEDWDVVDLEGLAGNLPIDAGGYLLLARSDECIAGHLDGDAFVCDLPADSSYSGISLPNSDDKWLHLVCGDELVDSAPVMWETLSPFCPQGGCAMGLSPDAWDGASNDDIASWCVPSVDAAFLNPNEETSYGSPGAMTECLALDWPAEGEVIFTELIASPQGGVREYMELANLAAEQRDLTFCTLRKWRVDDMGAEDPDTVREYLFGEDARELSLAGSATQLLSYSGCLWESEGDDCDGGEFPYSSIQLSADQEEHLALVCDDVVVDQVVFHADAVRVRDGHAWILDPGSFDAVANDNPDNWCEAAFDQKLDELSDPEGEDCNYGTPGEANECLVSQPEPPDPVCRCTTGLGPAGWWLALVGLVPLLRRQRP